MSDLEPGDTLIGFFLAQVPFKFWWFFLVGPIAALGMKTYYIAATDLGMHFYRLNLIGMIDQHDYFQYDEIRVLEIKTGMLQMPLQVEFKNHNVLKVRAQKKGVKTIPKITEALIESLRQKVKVR